MKVAVLGFPKLKMQLPGQPMPDTVRANEQVHAQEIMNPLSVFETKEVACDQFHQICGTIPSARTATFYEPFFNTGLKSHETNNVA